MTTATLEPYELALNETIAGLPDETSTRQERLLATVADPLAFALVYLWRHMMMPDSGAITMSPMHWDWNDLGLQLITKEPYRIALVAPRDSGKSTWWFLVIPLWAAAHGHSKFTAAFADSGTQAEIHLMTFKHELDTNELLRNDFPDLCTPAKRPTTGSSVADNRSLYVAASGFAFKAAGIDASNLGLKVNESRPDLLIFDDVEPDESNYSAYQAGKRLLTIQDAVLPMNTKARVVFCGTVTMSGGITHQLVSSVLKGDSEPPAQWILDENIAVHYYPPFLVDHNGAEESIWPQKWSIEYLQRIRHTRSFAKNFKNMPFATDGDYWMEADFRYGVPVPLTHTLLSIDPAVTTKRTSDYTGLAVISYKPTLRVARNASNAKQAMAAAELINPTQGTTAPAAMPACVVWDAMAVKLKGEFLRELALKIIEESSETDHPILMIYVEVNQGGDLWLGVFHNMPVPVKVMTNNINKHVRAAKTLTHYQRGFIWHAKELPALEEQMMGFPGLHDDMIDAVGTGVAYYAKRRAPEQKGVGSSVSYIR